MGLMQEAQKPPTSETTSPPFVFLTGGSSEIGAEITRTLAGNGINVIASHRKNRTADYVRAQVESLPGSVNFIQANIETSSGRQHFIDTAVGERPQGDALILNTFIVPSRPYVDFQGGAVDMGELNIVASTHLVEGFLDRLKPGSTLLRMNSSPAQYYPQVGGVEAYPVYGEAAKAHYEEYMWLRQMEERLNKKGVRLVTIAAPSVEGTRYLDLFNQLMLKRSDGKTSAQNLQNQLSAKLGLPGIVTQQDVAQRVLKILNDPNIKSGYVDLMSDTVFDTQAALERWYDPNKVYVQTIERMAESDGKRRGIARALVSKDQAHRLTHPRMIERIDVDKDGHYFATVKIEPHHGEGHFSDKSGFPRLLAGHKEIQAAIETISLVGNKLGFDGYARLRGFKGIVFKEVVKADGNHSIKIVPTLRSGSEKTAVFDVNIIDQTSGKITAEMKGVTIEMIADGDNEYLPEHQLIEAAAQAAGVVHMQSMDGDMMPLFGEIGPTKFFDKKLHWGDGVRFEAETIQVDQKTFSGEVKVFSLNGEHVATINGIKAAILPTKLAKRILR